MTRERWVDLVCRRVDEPYIQTSSPAWQSLTPGDAFLEQWAAAHNRPCFHDHKPYRVHAAARR